MVQRSKNERLNKTVSFFFFNGIGKVWPDLSVTDYKIVFQMQKMRNESLYVAENVYWII